MNDYSKVRLELLEMIRREMVGPGSESMSCSFENEIITDRPTQRYTCGMLYPQDETRIPHDEDVDDSGDTNAVSAEEDDGDNYLDRQMNLANQFYPSAMGLTVLTPIERCNPAVTVSGAWYRKCLLEDVCVKIGAGYEKIITSINRDDILEYNNDNLRPRNELDKEKTELLKTLIIEHAIAEYPELLKSESSPDYSLGKIIAKDYLDYNDLQPHYQNNDLLEYLSKIWTVCWSIDKLYQQHNYGWIRVPVEETLQLPDENDEILISDNLKLACHVVDQHDHKSCSIALINQNTATGRADDTQVFFQASLELRILDSKQSFTPFPVTKTSGSDPEEDSLLLLFRNRRRYATGHGCSVGWEDSENGIVDRIWTTHIPTCSVPAKLEFEIHELGDNPIVLDMYWLSSYSTTEISDLVSTLKGFADAYLKWIENKSKTLSELEKQHRKTAERHLNNCRVVYERMCKGIETISSNDLVSRCFRLMNSAMLMQRLHSRLQENERFPDSDPVPWPEYNTTTSFPVKWRPFQLAYILTCLESVVNSESDDRDIIDLIWFPTGGGKTEAYLGITAFTIFFERLTNQSSSRSVSVIMRYTLRLLASQQFQRASTLICACEYIRRKEDLFPKPVTIGLWIGSSATPNNLEKALRAMNRLTTGRSDENPFQVLSCPWCGTLLIKKNGIGMWGYREGRRPKRLLMYCPEKSCEFNDFLPIKIVDDDIYRDPPDFLFGTVDKFAQLPWKKEVSNLFGLDDENGTSPCLIIQDELHLITGPLGSIVGLYETAIDAFCSSRGRKPKLLASTATTRRAKEQVAMLYNRRLSQFPPPGLEISDSFYAREPSAEDDKDRLYIGIMSSCRTQTTTTIRLFACILQAIKTIQTNVIVRDHFWTLVGYFNSLRELGQMVTLCNDDIKDYMRRISKRNGHKLRLVYEPEELTSRVESHLIPEKLKALNIQYPDRNAIDILLASNMMSVGVDISRLGLMVVNGQPKTIAEYIQATSRIGRANPGLVITVHNGARSRDRSHYEQFQDFHRNFQKYVEPSTVTPFSSSARERALHAVVVSIIRHMFDLRGDKDAARISSLSGDEIDSMKKLIVERIKDTSEKCTATGLSAMEIERIEDEIDTVIDKWKSESETPSDTGFQYQNWKRRTGIVSLLYPAGSEMNMAVFETLLSMRNVDSTCSIQIRRINE